MECINYHAKGKKGRQGGREKLDEREGGRKEGRGWKEGRKEGRKEKSIEGKKEGKRQPWAASSLLLNTWRILFLSDSFRVCFPFPHRRGLESTFEAFRHSVESILGEAGGLGRAGWGVSLPPSISQTGKSLKVQRRRGPEVQSSTPASSEQGFPRARVYLGACAPWQQSHLKSFPKSFPAQEQRRRTVLFPLGKGSHGIHASRTPTKQSWTMHSLDSLSGLVIACYFKNKILIKV